jgi:hypothetical protein
MATVKRRVSRKHEPYITRDLKWYMDWKVNGYIDYLDMIDPDRLYTLEYDTEVPTKEELLNGIDQHYVQTYNPHSRKDEKEKEEKDNNTNWFFEGEIVLQNEIEDEITPLTYVDEIEKRKQELKTKRKQELKTKRKQEEKEAKERRIELAKIKEEREKIQLELLREKQLKEQTRRFVDNYYKEFKTKGLMDLYKQALDKVAMLKFEKLQSDIFDDISTTALEAWEYRLEYITKLIKKERGYEGGFADNYGDY